MGYGNEVYKCSGKIKYDMHNLVLKDGGNIQLWVCIEPKPKSYHKIVLIFPGTFDGASTNYIQQLVFDTNKKGFLSIVMVKRGCETNQLKTPKLMNPDLDDELFEVIDWINKRHNNPAIYAIGISMGASILIGLLGKHGEKSGIKAGVAWACPFDYIQVTHALKYQSPDGGIINLKLLDGIKMMAFKNYDLLYKYQKETGKIDLEKCFRAKFLQDYDKYLTAPLNGYKNVTELYEACNTAQYIKDIKVPTLFIHSLDDPICIKEMIPYESIAKNKNCMMILTQKGGHIEWFTGSIPQRWANKPTLEFLSYQAKKFGDA